MKTCKLLLTTAAATMMLTAAVGTASARSISTSHLGWRATFNPINLAFNFGTIGCSLTLEGSFHARTAAKTAGTLVGYVTRATGGPCGFGEWRYLSQTLPWHVRYRSFTGVLPNISSIAYDVIGFSFQYREPGGITCLIRSTEAQPMRLFFRREASGGVTSMEAVGSIPSGEECFGITGEVSGSTRAVTNEAGTRITVTLI